jgi:hypothetical protein
MAAQFTRHSSSAASFCSDSLQPCSLSSGRMPGGMSWQSMVTPVPPSASARFTMIFISPANSGACDSNSTTSTIFVSGVNSTNLPRTMSRCGDVLPAGECSQFLMRQRDSESAALSWFKYIQITRHVIRRQPRGHRISVKKCAIKRSCAAL